MFFYDGDSLVEELDTSGTPNILRRYIPGNSVDDTLGWYEGGGLGTPNWLHADEQGAVIATTDSSGAATPYAYSVTGEPKGGWSASAPAFRYTGQVAIASAAIYYYKARMYDPALLSSGQPGRPRPARHQGHTGAEGEQDPANRTKRSAKKHAK